jgi:hypothetical protein
MGGRVAFNRWKDILASQDYRKGERASAQEDARMKARRPRRQKQIASPPDILEELLMKESRPPINLGVADWRQRWEGGAYKQLQPWQLAWGLLRHSKSYSDDYWNYWVFDVEVPRDIEELSERYDLQRGVNPSLSAFDLTENPFRSTRARRHIRIYRWPEEVTFVLRPNQAIVLMDLSWPIPPQLAAAKRHLRPHKPPRLQLKIYPRYVCALDAKAAGATYAAIGKVLHPKQDEPEARLDRVKKDLRAARSLAARGYDFIARG